jgi:hypothetical protein
VYDLNYGERATVLIVLGLMLDMLGGFVSITGMVMIAVRAGQSHVGVYLIAGGFLPLALGVVRLTQAGAAGRAFRNGRPFVRR